jgi:carboxypeptidase Q
VNSRLAIHRSTHFCGFAFAHHRENPVRLQEDPMHYGKATAARLRTMSVVAVLVIGVSAPIAAQGRRAARDDVLARLRQAGVSDPHAWERLEYLCDRIGPRLAGSPAFQQAVNWAAELFRNDGLANVRLEPVTTELWVRGRESAVMTAPVVHVLPMLGLGESVGIPGLEAPVVVVRSFDELGPRVKGKIVLFNPNIPPEATGSERYGIYVPFRIHGPSRAAAFGAVAALVRAAPVNSLATAHTGTLQYDPEVPKIPAATVAPEYAEWITRLADKGVEVRVRLAMDAHTAGPVETANVVAEVRGVARPDEIVLIGAHLDSWDVGQGAQDDGAGVVQVIEALRLIHDLGARPARTIRAVLFVNEEHGTDGGKAYAAAHASEHHIAAFESDSGAGEPLEWSVAGAPRQAGWFLAAVKPIGLPARLGWIGTDIEPLADAGVFGATMRVDLPEYFDIHHTQADTLDKVDPQELRDGIAAVAELAWQLANAPSP